MNEPDVAIDRRYMLFPLTSAALWGAMYVVSKYGFSTVPPMAAGVARCAIGAAALLAALRFAGGGPFPESRRMGPRLGVWIAITIVMQFYGTDLSDAHIGALVSSAAPLATVLLGAVLLDERPSWVQGLGIAIGVIGFAVVVGSGSALDARSRWGVLLLLLSAVSWALYTVDGVRAVRAEGALPVSAWAAAWGCLFLVPPAIVESFFRHTTFDLRALGVVLYLGLGATALAWYLWYKGVERLPAWLASLSFFAQPVVGALLGALWLGERLGATFYAGGTLVMCGVLLAAWGSR
ncbi:MAG TPA: DMT family transporter [Candidatus Dormibacteraeota bacterium]|nr:DMT family transporter [Candidatus Dormibacteraeota bacterium]